MGALIEAVATASPRTRGDAGSLELAADAARQALKQARRDPCEIDLLVNTSVCSEDFVREPASAAFIQRLIGTNPEGLATRERSTLSFDLNNGACGLLNAVHVADAFLASRAARCALLVTSDTNPMRGGSDDYPFESAGGALLLRAGRPGEGFSAFRFATFGDDADTFSTRAVYRRGQAADGEQKEASHGSYALVVQEKPDLLEKSVERSREVVVRLLEEQGDEIDLVIPASSSPHFPALLRERLELAADQVVEPAPDSGRLHTVATAAALADAIASGRFSKARRVLFVSAGSGLTVAAALYYHEERHQEFQERHQED